MPAGGLATAGAGLLLGGAEAAWGNSQKNSYQRQINAISGNKPAYQIPGEENQIVNLAESRAGQGMSAASNQALTNNTNNTLSAGLNAALRGGGDANSLGNIVEKSQQGFNQNAIYDDQARMKNLENLQSSWARMSADKDKAYTLNELDPWKDKMAALHQQLAGANNMFMSGLGMAGGGFMSGLGKAFGASSPWSNPGGTSMTPVTTSGPSTFGTNTPAMGQQPTFTAPSWP